MSYRLNDVLEISVRTDPGKVRGHNEDAVFANPALGFAVLADGMGGYNAGEVASGMAITLLSTELENAFVAGHPETMEAATGRAFVRRCLAEKVALANTSIYNTAVSQPQWRPMTSWTCFGWR